MHKWLSDLASIAYFASTVELDTGFANKQAGQQTKDTHQVIRHYFPLVRDTQVHPERFPASQSEWKQAKLCVAAGIFRF